MSAGYSPDSEETVAECFTADHANQAAAAHDLSKQTLRWVVERFLSAELSFETVDGQVRVPVKAWDHWMDRLGEAIVSDEAVATGDVLIGHVLRAAIRWASVSFDDKDDGKRQMTRRDLRKAVSRLRETYPLFPELSEKILPKNPAYTVSKADETAFAI